MYLYWTWQKVHDAELDMRDLCGHHAGNPDPALQALLCQAARELLLLQASDWQFLITTATARDYAEHRIYSHHTEFKRLTDMARRYARGEQISDEDWAFLGELQNRDRLFPDVDPRWWAHLDHPPAC